MNGQSSNAKPSRRCHAACQALRCARMFDRSAVVNSVDCAMGVATDVCGNGWGDDSNCGDSLFSIAVVGCGDSGDGIGVARCCKAASTSSLVTCPPAPLPVKLVISNACSVAMAAASGVMRG